MRTWRHLPLLALLLPSACVDDDGDEVTDQETDDDTGTDLHSDPDPDTDVHTDGPSHSDDPIPQPPSVTLDGLSIDGGGSEEEVAAGATVHAEVEFGIANDASCSDCPAQIVLGLDGTALGCVYDGVPGATATPTTGSLDFPAPDTIGTFDVEARVFQATSCALAMAGFESTTPASDPRIGGITTYASSGAGDVQTLDETVTTTRFGGECYTRACPAGKTLLSIGVADPADTHAQYQAVSATSARFCNGTADIGDPDATLTLQLTCGTPTATQIRANEQTISPVSGSTSWHSVDVACAGGESMTGVGYGSDTDPPGGTYGAVTLRRSGGQGLRGRWSMFDANVVPYTHPARVVAICSTVAEPQTVTASATVGDGATGCATATCPAGQIAIGGGWSIAETPIMALYTSVYENRRIGTDQWRACYRSPPGWGSETITAEAYCVASR